MAGRLALDLAQMHALYLRGMTLGEVGAVVGTSAETVRRRLLSIGIRARKAAWSSDDVANLRRMYADGFAVTEIARLLGRSYYSVAIKAGRIGISVRRGKQARRQQKQHKQLTLAGAVTKKTMWRVFPHPRGMAGKKHTPETIKIVSNASRAAWERMKKTNTGNMSPAHRQRRSDQTSRRNAVRPASESYSRTKKGYRDDIPGLYFRSAWEANYARYLRWLKERGEIHDWAYEADTFWFHKIQRGIRSYRPDFKIWEKDGAEPYYVEVKGWMDKKSVTKIKRMAKYYPHVKLIVVDQRAYKATADICARLVPGWEK